MKNSDKIIPISATQKYQRDEVKFEKIDEAYIKHLEKCKKLKEHNQKALKGVIKKKKKSAV